MASETKDDMEKLNTLFDEIIDKRDSVFSFSKENLETAITTQLKKVMQMACDKCTMLPMAVTTLSILLMIKHDSTDITLPIILLSNEEHRLFLDACYNTAHSRRKELFTSLRIHERQWQ